MGGSFYEENKTILPVSYSLRSPIELLNVTKMNSQQWCKNPAPLWRSHNGLEELIAQLEEIVWE